MSRGVATQRLDDATTELDFLQTKISHLDQVSGRLVTILDTFDGRLKGLEDSMQRIYKPTENLTRMADNIGHSLEMTRQILERLKIPSIEQELIKRGPSEHNTLPYLKAMSRLKDVIDADKASPLKPCQKAVPITKQLLKVGMLHLEDLFRKCLSSVSEPLSESDMLDPSNDTETEELTRQLAQLSTYFITSETETEYSVDVTKPYIKIRGDFLVRSLQPIAQDCQMMEYGSAYERGSSRYLTYMSCIVSMIEKEREFAACVLEMRTQKLDALHGSIKPARDMFVKTGYQLNLAAKRLNYNDSVFLLDIIDKYESECKVKFLELDDLDMTEVTDLFNTLELTELKVLYDFMDHVKGNRDGATPNLSKDGTVHELTSNTLNYLKRLYSWREMVCPLLVILGDGGWNRPPPSAGRVSDDLVYGESSKGSALLKRFFEDILDQLSTSLQTKSRSYKRPALATIFLLNNYNYILRQIRTRPFIDVFDDRTETKFGTQVKTQKDAYQESWKTCVECLMDVTYVRDGAIRTSLGNADRQVVKDRFKSFNTEFETIWKEQNNYAIPDSELRQQMIRDVKNVLIPMYNRFRDKHKATDFTKNPEKYIKYDQERLDKMLSHLFEPTA